MSVMRMFDESGRSMQMVDGVMSMGMMSVVKMVISCHGYLSVGYIVIFGEFFSFVCILVHSFFHENSCTLVFFMFFSLWTKGVSAAYISLALVKALVCLGAIVLVWWSISLRVSWLLVDWML